MIWRRQFLTQSLLGCAADFALRSSAKGAASSNVVDVTNYGAIGDGKTKDTAAVQKAIDSCAAKRGGRVILPAGNTFLCGNIELKSNVELYLENGAILKASGDREDFSQFGALLFAKDAQDVVISGKGAIEGNFPAYLNEMQEGGFKVTFPFLGPYDPLYAAAEKDIAHGRPRMVLLVGCKGATLRDIRIKNAPTWTVHVIGCENLLIDGLAILNDLRVPNCDGIDIDHCRNVRVANCNIQAGDDCIILKASRNFTQYGPCSHVTVTGCTMSSSSAAIKFEPEGPETIRDIVITSCTIERSNRGICILNRDGALIENIICSDMVIGTELRASMWWGAGEPVHISNLPRNAETKVGPVRRLRFNNLLCHGESGIFLHGGKDSVIEDVVFSNVEVSVGRTSQIEGGYYDLRPGNPSPGLYKHQIAGIHCEHVKELSLLNVSVKWAESLPDYYGPGLDVTGSDGLKLINVDFRAAHPERDAKQIIDGSRKDK